MGRKHCAQGARCTLCVAAPDTRLAYIWNLAEHVQHQQRQEAKVPARVQHAQRGQQARRRQPAALERGMSGGRGGATGDAVG